MSVRAIHKRTTWQDDDGFEYTFEPIEDSITTKKTKDGYEVRYLTRDEFCESPSDSDWEDNNLFLVHYHRQFWVERKDIISEQDLKNWYRQDFEDYDDTIFPFENDYYIFSVSAYIHSGVALSLGDNFPCDSGGWDTSHVGAVLVSKEEWPDLEGARKAAEGLIETWNMYLCGDVYVCVMETYDENRNPLDYECVGEYYGEKYALEDLETFV